MGDDSGKSELVLEDIVARVEGMGVPAETEGEEEEWLEEMLAGDGVYYPRCLLIEID